MSVWKSWSKPATEIYFERVDVDTKIDEIFEGVYCITKQQKRVQQPTTPEPSICEETDTQK